MENEHLVKEASKSKAEGPPEDSLERIRTYGKEYLKLSAELQVLQDSAAAKAKEVTKLAQELIPESMLAVDMTAFKLSTGETVAIKEQLSCSVKDYDKLYEFLEEHGDDALMKTTLELGKLPKSIMKLVIASLKENFDLIAESKLYIHPQTLKAHFTKLCGIGDGNECEVPLVELDKDMLGTFTYYKTTVK